MSSQYITSYSKDDHDKLESEVAQLQTVRDRIDQEKSEVSGEFSVELTEEKKTESIRFHFEKGAEKEAERARLQAERDKLTQDQKNLKSDVDLFNSLLAKKALLSKMVSYKDVFVILTDRGVQTVKDLSVRMYRFSDQEFSAYESEMNETMKELTDIVISAKTYFGYLEGIMTDESDRSVIMSTAMGLAKLSGDMKSIASRFMTTYNEMGSFTRNLENRLMAAQIITGSGKDISGEMEQFKEVFHEVHHKIKIPKESAAGVASMIYLAKRYDGTYPYENLQTFTGVTPSYEAAAVMATMDRPVQATVEKFKGMRAIFTGWGYTTSEDVELSSAYIAISDFQPNEIKDKVSAIIDTMRNYLEYPLVASTVIATVPVMESNETLDLLRKAFNILQRNLSGFENSELMAIAVNLIHGIRNELIRKVSSQAPTPAVASTPYHFYYMPYPMLFPMFLPMMMIQGSYYSTFSGIGGVHPAHIHSVGGFSG